MSSTNTEPPSAAKQVMQFGAPLTKTEEPRLGPKFRYLGGRVDEHERRWIRRDERIRAALLAVATGSFITVGGVILNHLWR